MLPRYFVLYQTPSYKYQTFDPYLYIASVMWIRHPLVFLLTRIFICGADLLRTPSGSRWYSGKVEVQACREQATLRMPGLEEARVKPQVPLGELRGNRDQRATSHNKQEYARARVRLPDHQPSCW